MGIVVDTKRSEVKFSDPLIPRDALNAITRQVTYDMQSFEVSFVVSFDPDPKNGIGGAPKEPDLWRIGIVQDVLFHHLHIEYENKKVFRKAWKDAASDYKEGTISKPFFGDPELSPGRMKQRPVADIWYTSQGYGELLNPNTATGVSTTNRPDIFNMWDEPSGGSALRFDGSMIKRLEKVLSFQTWLVAKTKVSNNGIITDRIELLAHIPVFSLVFWLETTAPKRRATTSLDTPPYDWGMLGVNGFYDPKRMNRKATGFGGLPSVIPQSGGGGRTPVMAGVSANDRANAFLTASGLQ